MSSTPFAFTSQKPSCSIPPAVRAVSWCAPGIANTNSTNACRTRICSAGCTAATSIRSPRIARRNFFTVEPDKPFCQLPRHAIGGKLERHDVSLPELDAVVGNPPYVRYQDIPKTADKGVIREQMREYMQGLVAKTPGKNSKHTGDNHCATGWPSKTVEQNRSNCPKASRNCPTPTTSLKRLQSISARKAKRIWRATAAPKPNCSSLLRKPACVEIFSCRRPKKKLNAR